MRKLAIGSMLIALAVGMETGAADWPQFLGPERNGVYTGPELSESWDSSGPPVAWSRDVGAGLSGPVIVDGRVVLFHRVRNREIVEAFDREKGTSLWQYGYPTNYRDDFGFDEGPRAVPVVADGIVYTFGAQGQLHAVDLESGEGVWSEDTMRRFRVPKGFFGAAGSPLVEDGRVIANIGGRDAGIVAFEAKTGEVLWRATRTGPATRHRSASQSPIAGMRSSSRGTAWWDLTPKLGTSCSSVDGGRDQRRPSMPHRQSSSMIGSSCPPSTGPAPACCAGMDAG